MNKKAFTMILTEELCDVLDELAQKKGLTRMSLIRMIIVEYLDKEEQ